MCLQQKKNDISETNLTYGLNNGRFGVIMVSAGVLGRESLVGKGTDSVGASKELFVELSLSRVGEGFWFKVGSSSSSISSEEPSCKSDGMSVKSETRSVPKYARSCET